MPRMLWLAHSVPRPLPWLFTPDCSFSGEGCDQSQPEGERAFNVALLAVGRGLHPTQSPSPRHRNKKKDLSGRVMGEGMLLLRAMLGE